MKTKSTPDNITNITRLIQSKQRISKRQVNVFRIARDAVAEPAAPGLATRILRKFDSQIRE